VINSGSAEDGASSICTTGDLNFRAMILDRSRYIGLAFSPYEADYSYFPWYWDPTFFSNIVDISGTTPDNPAEYVSFLLEPHLIFSQAQYSVGTITGIRALDVPTNAVAIAGNGTDGFDISFEGAFFDDVVFEVQASTGNYYVKLVRNALRARDNFGPGTTERYIIAQLFLDEHDSYQNYDVYATLNYEDGSYTIVKAESTLVEEHFNGDAAGEWEVYGGKGLKQADFRVPCTFEDEERLSSVNFTAVKKNALSGSTFGGTYCGSKKGVTYDVKRRRIVY
jgi:hypothetical protein